MAAPGNPPRPRVLDPVDRLSEILFGLIMAMTFTGSVRAAEADAAELRTLLYAALGCNVAWGVVDGVMYVMTAMIGRDRTRVLLGRLRTARSEEEGRRLVADSLPDGLADVMQPEELEALRRSVVRVPVPAGRARVTRDDLRAALAVFLLVSLSTFPVVLPFLLLSDPELALRSSHATGLLMLFLVGSAFGRYSGARPLLAGLSMMAIGVALVLLTIVLGG